MALTAKISAEGRKRSSQRREGRLHEWRLEKGRVERREEEEERETEREGEREKRKHERLFGRNEKKRGEVLPTGLPAWSGAQIGVD